MNQAGFTSYFAASPSDNTWISSEVEVSCSSAPHFRLDFFFSRPCSCKQKHGKKNMKQGSVRIGYGLNKVLCWWLLLSLFFLLRALLFARLALTLFLCAGICQTITVPFILIIIVIMPGRVEIKHVIVLILFLAFFRWPFQNCVMILERKDRRRGS